MATPSSGFIPSSDSFTMGSSSSAFKQVKHSGRSIGRVLDSAGTGGDATPPLPKMTKIFDATNSRSIAPVVKPEPINLTKIIELYKQEGSLPSIFSALLIASSSSSSSHSTKERLPFKAQSKKNARAQQEATQRAVAQESQKQKARIAALEKRVKELAEKNERLCQQEAAFQQQLARFCRQQNVLHQENKGLR